MTNFTVIWEFSILMNFQGRKSYCSHLKVSVILLFFNPFIKNNGHLCWYRSVYFFNAIFSSYNVVTVCHIWIINFDLYSSHMGVYWFTWTYLMHYITECYSCLQNSQIIAPYFYSPGDFIFEKTITFNSVLCLKSNSK
jgi:hypothetical protein